MSPLDKQLFRNEKGAIDLASIMVGIIVIGLIGGVIAATVFAVIPWVQDKAAKQQLDSVSMAQSAYKARASDTDAASAGYTPNSYANSEGLQNASLLKAGDTYCTVPSGSGYTAYSLSASGKIFAITDKNTNPQQHNVTLAEAEQEGCGFLADNLPDSAFVKRTSLTYKCDTDSTGELPMMEKVIGKLTIKGSDGTTIEREYANEVRISATFVAGVEYKVIFDGTYGAFHSWDSNKNKIDPKCVRSLDNWGKEAGVRNAESGFYGASNLTSVPDSIPKGMANVRSLFDGASSLNDPNISKWDVSSLTSANHMFSRAKSFNQPLNDWDTSKVTGMRYMFSGATAFNQPLNDWDVSKVADMYSMFNDASSFNQPLDKWNTSNVTNMSYMFAGASAFNQSLDTWNTSNVTDMGYMFSYATLFDQSLDTWDTANVTNMSNMFASAKAFNKPLNTNKLLNTWNTAKVTNMSSMFSGAAAFNQPLNDWNTTKVTNMSNMFLGASAFDQNISSWKFDVIPTHNKFSNSIPSDYLPKWQ